MAKIYFGEWRRQKDMLEYLGIDSLPPHTTILAACKDRYEVEIFAYQSGHLVYDYQLSKRELRLDNIEDSIDLSPYIMKNVSGYLDRVKEIERIHVCTV